MRLTGEQEEQFIYALVDAFPNELRLGQMLQFRLEKSLAELAGSGGPLFDLAYRVFVDAKAKGWTDQLIVAARESNPGNERLLVFAQQFGLAPASPPRPELEKIIKQANGFLDIARWRQCLGEIEAQVCRIEIPVPTGTTYGTGFLLGPDVVMTNHHVIRSLLADDGGTPEAKPEQVILRFDYKRLTDSATINPGKEYHLATGDAPAWLIDASPPSKVDLQSDPKTGEPLDTEIDYALLRTAERPGADKVGTGAEPQSPARGWIEFPKNPQNVEKYSALFIVQHPKGDPLMLALDTVTDLNASRTRLRYATNTQPGSSGSPCFNVDWQVVALHHSGDPSFAPAYNEGIPIGAIAKLLSERGHFSKLDKQEE